MQFVIQIRQLAVTWTQLRYIYAGSLAHHQLAWLRWTQISPSPNTIPIYGLNTAQAPAVVRVGEMACHLVVGTTFDFETISYPQLMSLGREHNIRIKVQELSLARPLCKQAKDSLEP